MRSYDMTPKGMRHTLLAAALLALAACGGKPDDAGGEASPPPSAEAPSGGSAPAASPAAAAAPAAADATPADAALGVADIDAYARGMEKENALLREEFGKLERARAAGDAEAETTALFAMTSNDIDVAGAQGAGLAPARYGFVKERIDEVQAKLDMLESFRNMPGDSSEAQAQLGDPYAGFAADVAAALRARQAQLAGLRAEAVTLRLKAAGG